MRSSKREFEEFLSSNVWQDFKEQILLRLTEARNSLEDPTVSREQDMFNKGKAEVLRELSDLPDFIIESWEALKKEEKNEVYSDE